MPKYYGEVGYAEMAETAPGVYSEVMTERKYRGDVVTEKQRLDSTDTGVNDNVSVRNNISIVADAYAYEHFFAIRYVRWMGACWKVTDVEVQRPRLILTLGGVWNGPTYQPPTDSGEDLP